MKKILTIIMLLGWLNLLGQKRCDSLSKEIWTILEHPPQMNLTNEILESKLNSGLEASLNGLENVSFIYAMYYVNCKGEDYKYRIATLKNNWTEVDSTSQFSKSIINLLQKEIDFEPGYIEVKRRNKIEQETVDYQGSLTIKFKDNKFYVLSDKERLKHFKKKK